MDDSFNGGDIRDLFAAQSAHTLVLRLLLKSNPELAKRIREFAQDFETLSHGADDLRSARVTQDELLQMTAWLDEKR